MIGLPKQLCDDDWADIQVDPRGGFIHLPPPSGHSAPGSLVLCSSSVKCGGCKQVWETNGASNRILSTQVYTSLGGPISETSLGPLDVAQAMLAAVVGHASLFFPGGFRIGIFRQIIL